MNKTKKNHKENNLNDSKTKIKSNKTTVKSNALCQFSQRISTPNCCTGILTFSLHNNHMYWHYNGKNSKLKIDINFPLHENATWTALKIELKKL